MANLDNNCSTDGTNEFLQKYAKYHSKLNILTTEQNLGVSGGFALGIESACHTVADWIGVMDDDVMLHPEVLVEIARHAEPRSILS